MKRITMVTLGLVAMFAFGVGAALASGGKSEESSRSGSPEVAVQATNARLVALVNGDTAGGPHYHLIRQKGVRSVTNPSAGTFCIRPKASTGINPSTAVASVTTDWYYTTGNDSVAMWASSDDVARCPSGTFEVKTFDISSTADDNAVGFLIVVP